MLVGRVCCHSQSRQPERSVPCHASLHSWEGSVSGARKGTRLPALEGPGPSGSVRSILSRAALPRLPDSNKQTNKQSPTALFVVVVVVIVINGRAVVWAMLP